MTTFFAGNDKLILIKKQVDADTAVTDFTTATALRVYEWSADPARVVGPINESDNSADESDSHVSAFVPAFSFGIYGRPSELDLIAEAILGANDDSATLYPTTTHTATPDQETPYFSVLVVDPFENTRYEGCRLGAASFTAQDTGETELRVTGLAWQARTLTHGITTPSPMPTPADELPFIYAECTVKYAGSSEGRSSQFTVNVNRNLFRAQGDAGFKALALVNLKRIVDGSVTRYVSDGGTFRAVDTGTEAGTVPTSTIFTESFSVGFTRGAGTANRQFLIASQKIAYETREQALNLDGQPIAEVLGWRAQREADPADKITIVTVNSKSTTEG